MHTQVALILSIISCVLWRKPFKDLDIQKYFTAQKYQGHVRIYNAISSHHVLCILTHLLPHSSFPPHLPTLPPLSHTHTHTHTHTPCSQSRHMEFNFPHTIGSGIAPLMKHTSNGCVDLINQLCIYDSDERMNAKQALKHPYFKDLRYIYKNVNLYTHKPCIYRASVNGCVVNGMCAMAAD